jgi:hypothetical protein
MNNKKICEICGTDKTYQRANRETPDWTKTETGVICKSCYSKDYKSRTYVSHRKTPLSGPCVECNSETSYTEKDGYMHWYSGPNGTICKRCWNNFREKIMLPGLCVRCNTVYTHHGWSNTPEGTICNKCYKSNYSKIKRGGDCSLCGQTSCAHWRNDEDHGRICGSCYHKIYGKRIKKEVLLYYSKNKLQCVNCGFNKNINGLELDHIEGGGSKRRKELGADGGWNYMAKLKKLNFPSGYQVLCATCNKIKQIEIDPK